MLTIDGHMALQLRYRTLTLLKTSAVTSLLVSVRVVVVRNPLDALLPRKARGRNCDALQPPVSMFRSCGRSTSQQHLPWMLGKTGHGRTVRYEYIGPQYRKHVHLKDALNNAASLDDLLTIASHCLPGFDN
jgi:hypothetical protein